MNDGSKKVSKIYDRIAHKYSAAFDNDVSDNHFLDKFLTELKAGSAVLDIGCGTGREIRYFSDKGMEVKGIDLSPAMLEIARKNYPDTSLELCDVREMKYQNGTFDGVWAGYSLFHLNQADFVKVLEKIRSILKNGGIFALVMQEGEGEVEANEPFLPGEKMPITLYKPEKLKELLQNAGFEVVDEDFILPTAEIELPYRKILLVCKKS